MIASARHLARRLIDPEGMAVMFLHRAVHQAFEQWSDVSFSSALDYGCGDRPYNREISRVARRVVGADIGVNSLAEVTVSPGGRLPFDDASFDLVASFQVLEHVEDYQDYLHECARVCRHGGFLVLSAPSVWPFHPHPKDFRRWMLPGLTHDLECAGFTITKTWAVLNPVSSAMQYLLSVCRYTIWRHGVAARCCVRLLAMWFNPQILLSEKVFNWTLRVGAGNYVVVATRM